MQTTYSRPALQAHKRGQLAGLVQRAKVSNSRASAQCIRCEATRHEPGHRLDLPIFLLSGVVALPAVKTPLMIFEARYRVLFSTLLAGEDKIEEGLVQRESPFCGTKEFGMLLVTGDGRIAGIGTLLRIVEHECMEDGRILINNIGFQRFIVRSVIKEKPVLLANVEILPEDDDSSQEIQDLATEVTDLLRSVIRMNVKMGNISATADQLEPEELTRLKPRDLSFFVASFFGGEADARMMQQGLLEENSTLVRLQREKGVLAETARFYSAFSAVEGAFGNGDSTATPLTEAKISEARQSEFLLDDTPSKDDKGDEKKSA